MVVVDIVVVIMIVVVAVKHGTARTYFEASGTVFWYNGQLVLFGKLPGILFPNENKGPDEPEVTLGNAVIGLHRAQKAVVEDRHEERLGQIVQVLPECQHVVSVTSVDKRWG